MLLVERVAVERVVAEELLVERVGVALVVRVVEALLVERVAVVDALLGRLTVVLVERVLVLLVERVAVALVGRPERTSVELFTDCERFTVFPPRADSPRDTLLPERVTAVFVLPKVRELLFTAPRSLLTVL